MYFYQFHIGDYRTSTGHLSNEEDLAYRRLIDMYYMTEKPIPLDLVPVARKIKSTVEIIERLITDKLFIKQDDGYHNRRCDEEIYQYKKQVEHGKKGADKRWGKDREPIGSLSGANGEPNQTPMPNHEPLTMNHEPKTKNTRFVAPIVAEVRAYCEERKNGLDAQKFFDYYQSKGWVVGKAPMKDWRAAIRTWEGQQRLQPKNEQQTEQDGPRRNEKGQLIDEWGRVIK